MKSDMIWTLVAFAFYLAGMLLIGAAYMKKKKTRFFGGRGLNGGGGAFLWGVCCVFLKGER